MQTQQIAPTSAPVVPATANVKVQEKEQENYRTGHGCLTLSLMILAAAVVVVAAIMIFGTPTT